MLCISPLIITPSSRTSRIEGSLRENSAMLKEIHSWWSQNLRGAATARNDLAPEGPFGQSLGLPGATRPLSFEVYPITDGTSQRLCPQAGLHDDWHETASPRLFVCQCAESKVIGHTTDHSRVENISRKQHSPTALSCLARVSYVRRVLTRPVSPLCFPFREAGNAASWMLFKALDKPTSQMVLINIRIVSASGKRKKEILDVCHVIHDKY